MMSRSDTNDDWLRVKEAYEMIKTAEGRRRARGILQRRRAIASSSVVGDFVKLSECDDVSIERGYANSRGNDQGDKPQATNRGTLYQYQCRCGDIISFDVLDPNGRKSKGRGRMRDQIEYVCGTYTPAFSSPPPP